jgi:hypothetical protein
VPGNSCSFPDRFSFLYRSPKHKNVLMAEPTSGARGPGFAPGQSGYPLQQTAALLNDRLRLYLSPQQQRGLATGLLIGAALGAALLAWSLVGLARGRR